MKKLNYDRITTTIEREWLSVEAWRQYSTSEVARFAQDVRGEVLTTRIVFLTVHSDADFVRRCLSAGAFGYVVKRRIATDLLPAIRAALAGNVFISDHLANEN
jgi:DNA-binding NarL/FixJ family response regulator